MKKIDIKNTNIEARFINFGSIGQLRNTIYNITKHCQYIGKDKDGNLMYDNTKKLPIVDVIATEKIHGTNASVCYFNDVFWTQSRKNIITIEKDNAGFSAFANGKKEIFIKIIKSLAKEYKIDLNENIISLYMEWAGNGIQKLSALTGLDKRAMIFQYFKVSPVKQEENIGGKWFETKINGKYIDSKKNNIFNIMNFPYYRYTLDLNNIDGYYEKLVKLVKEKIEPDSPVGESFGIEGNIGEGIVVNFMYDGILYNFKVKGEKHTNTKVNKINKKNISTEEEKKRIDFANLVCTPSRLMQMYDLANDTINGGEPDKNKIGNFIKLVIEDIIKEETDIMTKQGFCFKDIAKYINKICSKWYINELNIHN